MCIDYHSLNWQTRLNVADLFDRLRKAKVFSLIYLNHAYQQVFTHEGNELITAFLKL